MTCTRADSFFRPSFLRRRSLCSSRVPPHARTFAGKKSVTNPKQVCVGGCVRLYTRQLASMFFCRTASVEPYGGMINPCINITVIQWLIVFIAHWVQIQRLTVSPAVSCKLPVVVQVGNTVHATVHFHGHQMHHGNQRTRRNLKAGKMSLW